MKVSCYRLLAVCKHILAKKNLASQVGSKLTGNRQDVYKPSMKWFPLMNGIMKHTETNITKQFGKYIYLSQKLGYST